MKRYETMTKEEIIDLEAHKCAGCVCDEQCDATFDKTCGEIKKEWLHADIKTVPLVATIDTVEKLREVEKDHKNYCRSKGECKGCDYFSNFSRNCFARYLEQEVEI